LSLKSTSCLLLPSACSEGEGGKQGGWRGRERDPGKGEGEGSRGEREREGEGVMEGGRRRVEGDGERRSTTQKGQEHYRLDLDNTTNPYEISSLPRLSGLFGNFPPARPHANSHAPLQ